MMIKQYVAKRKSKCHNCGKEIKKGETFLQAHAWKDYYNICELCLYDEYTEIANKNYQREMEEEGW